MTRFNHARNLSRCGLSHNAAWFARRMLQHRSLTGNWSTASFTSVRRTFIVLSPGFMPLEFRTRCADVDVDSYNVGWTTESSRLLCPRNDSLASDACSLFRAVLARSLIFLWAFHWTHRFSCSRTSSFLTSSECLPRVGVIAAESETERWKIQPAYIFARLWER